MSKTKVGCCFMHKHSPLGLKVGTGWENIIWKQYLFIKLIAVNSTVISIFRFPWLSQENNEIISHILDKNLGAVYSLGQSCWNIITTMKCIGNYLYKPVVNLLNQICQLIFFFHILKHIFYFPNKSNVIYLNLKRFILLM